MRMRRAPRAILEGFPTSKLVKFRYVTHIVLDPSANNFNVHSFRANSPSDPDYTGTTGRQPLGWDAWAQQYGRYVCVGSKCNMQFVPVVLASQTPGYYGMTMAKDPNALSQAYSGDVDSLLESKLTGRKVLMAGNTNSTYFPTSVTKKFSSRKWFGKNNARDDNALSAPTSGAVTPTERAYFSVWAASINGNNPFQAHFKITIDYIVLFTQPCLQPIDGPSFNVPDDQQHDDGIPESKLLEEKLL
jgi:hypothetical protein